MRWRVVVDKRGVAWACEECGLLLWDIKLYISIAKTLYTLSI